MSNISAYLDALFGILIAAKIGVATTFSSKNDIWNPNPKLYCTNRVLNDQELVVAHPKLPCGSRVFIYAPRTNRGVWATVLDRGPRRSLIDLSEGTTKAIKANGMETVIIVPRRK